MNGFEIWDYKNGVRERQYPINQVFSSQFTSDGKSIFLGKHKIVRLDLSQEKIIKEYGGLTAVTWSNSFISDNLLKFETSEGIKVWDMENNSLEF